jgi:putative flippase GtrA
MINKFPILFNKFLKSEIAKQFVKFCLVGFLNTLVDFGVYLFFSRVIGLYYLYANLLAVFVAMTSSFVLNKYWTFKNNDHDLSKQYLKFTLVNVVYFLLNNAIFFSAVHYLKFFDIWAKVVAIGIGLIWNFLANRYFTFRKNSRS